MIDRAVAPSILVAWAFVLTTVTLTNWPIDGPTIPWLVALAMLPGGAIASVATRWTGTAPFPPVLVTGATAMIVGVVGVPGWLGTLALAVAGLAWLGVVDVVRAGTRIDLTTHGVVVRTGWLSKPVRFLYSDLHNVDPRPHKHHRWGALVLQTEHGLFPLSGLPDVEGLADRIRTRIEGGLASDEVEAVSGVAGRVKQLLETGY